MAMFLRLTLRWEQLIVDFWEELARLLLTSMDIEYPIPYTIISSMLYSMFHKTRRIAIWFAGIILFHTYPLGIVNVGFHHLRDAPSKSSPISGGINIIYLLNIWFIINYFYLLKQVI